MTGEPTVPVPIPDLLAVIGWTEERPVFDGNVSVPSGDRDLIVRGVRDLAAENERLRARTHEIQAEEMEKRRALDAECAYWRRIRDKISPNLPRTGEGSSIRDFQYALALAARVETLTEYFEANEAWQRAVCSLTHDGTERLRFVAARRAALAGQSTTETPS